MNDSFASDLVAKYGETMGYEELKGLYGYRGKTISFNNWINNSNEPQPVRLRAIRQRVGRHKKFKTRKVAEIFQAE